MWRDGETKRSDNCNLSNLSPRTEKWKLVQTIWCVHSHWLARIISLLLSTNHKIWTFLFSFNRNKSGILLCRSDASFPSEESKESSGHSSEFGSAFWCKRCMYESSRYGISKARYRCPRSCDEDGCTFDVREGSRSREQVILAGSVFFPRSLFRERVSVLLQFVELENCHTSALCLLLFLCTYWFWERVRLSPDWGFCYRFWIGVASDSLGGGAVSLEKFARMESASSFLDGRQSNWNYASLKNFNKISAPVQQHLLRVCGWCDARHYFCRIAVLGFGCELEGFDHSAWR